MPSLFTSQTPTTTTDASDGTPTITTATVMRFAADGQISAVRFYTTTNPGGNWLGLVWQMTSNTAGTLLGSASATFPGQGGQWVEIPLSPPVSVTAGPMFVIGVNNDQGRYVATTNFFGTALTNGDITAPAHGSDPVGFGALLNGRFQISASTTAFPNTSAGGAGSNYFVDVVYSSDSVAPTVPGSFANTSVSATTADFSWTASSDAVGVTGYEIQVVGN